MAQIEGVTSLVPSPATTTPSWYSPQWTAQLLDCFLADCKVICLAFTCPCAQAAKNFYELTDEGSSCCGDCIWMGIQCICPLYYLSSTVGIRMQLRRHMGIVGGECEDSLIHICCHCCALVQENREIRARKKLGYRYMDAPGHNPTCECKKCLPPPQIKMS